MSRSVATVARAMQSHSLASQLPRPRVTEPKVASACREQATGVQDAGIQPGTAWLGTIEEALIRLGWKQEYVATAILRIDAPRLSKALRQIDGKVFDVRWLGLLAAHEIAVDREVLRPFLPMWHRVMTLKFGLKTDSDMALLLAALTSGVDNLLAFAKLATARTAVSE